MTDYSCRELMFWFWLLYHHFPGDERRKEIITSAQQCKMVSDVLASDLIWAFRLENV